MTVEPLPALPQRLLMTQDQPDIRLLGALTCEEVVYDRQFYLARDLELEEKEAIRDYIAGFVMSPKEALRPLAIGALGTLGAT